MVLEPATSVLELVAGVVVATPLIAQVVPAGIFPGQRMMQGTRVPPSQQVPLPSRNGPAEPA